LAIEFHGKTASRSPESTASSCLIPMRIASKYKVQTGRADPDGRELLLASRG
jgi:hypothetical protein